MLFTWRCVYRQNGRILSGRLCGRSADGLHNGRPMEPSLLQCVPREIQEVERTGVTVAACLWVNGTPDCRSHRA